MFKMDVDELLKGRTSTTDAVFGEPYPGFAIKPFCPELLLGVNQPVNVSVPSSGERIGTHQAPETMDTNTMDLISQTAQGVAAELTNCWIFIVPQQGKVERIGWADTNINRDFEFGRSLVHIHDEDYEEVSFSQMAELQGPTRKVKFKVKYTGRIEPLDYHEEE